MGSYACAHVTPITVWVVSKNESNYLLENKLMFIELFFCKKIPLSRRVGYVMGGSVRGSVSG